MNKTIEWLLITTTLFVGASGIVSYPAKAFEGNSNSGQLSGVSFELAQVIQQERRPSDVSPYNFSINYSDRRETSDPKSDRRSDRGDSTWTNHSHRSDRATGAVSIPEPSTLVGLISVSSIFVLKRKSARKA